MPPRDFTLASDGAVAVLTIDRPHAMNALGARAMQDLETALDDLEHSDPRVLVITGAGERAFISGGDLKELQALRSEEDAAEMARRMRNTLDRLAALPMPVIAALNGDAYGGGAEVAIACDIRIASAHARFGFTQAKLGIMPAWGGVERLAALVGRGRALYLLSTGRVLSAAEAREWGVVEEVAPSGDFAARWRQLASELAGVPRDALFGIKATVEAAVPGARPELAPAATQRFAGAWVSDDHWRAAAELARKRREAKQPIRKAPAG